MLCHKLLEKVSIISANRQGNAPALVWPNGIAFSNTCNATLPTLSDCVSSQPVAHCLQSLHSNILREYVPICTNISLNLKVRCNRAESFMAGSCE